MLLALEAKRTPHVVLDGRGRTHQAFRSDIINGVPFNTRFFQPHFRIRYRFVQTKQIGQRLLQTGQRELGLIGHVLDLYSLFFNSFYPESSLHRGRYDKYHHWQVSFMLIFFWFLLYMPDA